MKKKVALFWYPLCLVQMALQLLPERRVSECTGRAKAVSEI
jgi:hypothetical protein